MQGLRQALSSFRGNAIGSQTRKEDTGRIITGGFGFSSLNSQETLAGGLAAWRQEASQAATQVLLLQGTGSEHEVRWGHWTGGRQGHRAD